MDSCILMLSNNRWQTTIAISKLFIRIDEKAFESHQQPNSIYYFHSKMKLKESIQQKFLTTSQLFGMCAKIIKTTKKSINHIRSTFMNGLPFLFQFSSFSISFSTMIRSISPGNFSFRFQIFYFFFLSFIRGSYTIIVWNKRFLWRGQKSKRWREKKNLIKIDEIDGSWNDCNTIDVCSCSNNIFDKSLFHYLALDVCVCGWFVLLQQQWNEDKKKNNIKQQLCQQKKMSLMS